MPSLGLKKDITELVAHDAAWENLARQTIQQLWQIFDSAANDIQHIGSTSIPNIKAKPIIDIAVALEDWTQFERVVPELEKSGFSYHGWFIINRIIVLNRYVVSRTNERFLTHHIHIVQFGGTDWRHHIIFRDYLKTHPMVAKTYEALKIELASQYHCDTGRKKIRRG